MKPDRREGFMGWRWQLVRRAIRQHAANLRLKERWSISRVGEDSCE